MAEDAMKPDEIDWRQAGFDGARRAQLRRWAALPLEDALDVVEEMSAMAGELAGPPQVEHVSPVEPDRAADGAQSGGCSDDKRETEGRGCTQSS